MPHVTLAAAIMLMAGLAYMVFLIATWQRFQHDRDSRELHINELLDRMPKPAE